AWARSHWPVHTLSALPPRLPISPVLPLPAIHTSWRRRSTVRARPQAHTARRARRGDLARELDAAGGHADRHQGVVARRAVATEVGRARKVVGGAQRVVAGIARGQRAAPVTVDALTGGLALLLPEAGAERGRGEHQHGKAAACAQAPQ